MTDEDINKLLSSSEQDFDMDLIKKHCTELMKKFDAVQIFCSRHEVDTGGTVNCHTGSGNWFARYGQVRKWVLIEDRE